MSPEIWHSGNAAAPVRLFASSAAGLEPSAPRTEVAEASRLWSEVGANGSPLPAARGARRSIGAVWVSDDGKFREIQPALAEQSALPRKIPRGVRWLAESSWWHSTFRNHSAETAKGKGEPCDSPFEFNYRPLTERFYGFTNEIHWSL